MENFEDTPVKNTRGNRTKYRSMTSALSVPTLIHKKRHTKQFWATTKVVEQPQVLLPFEYTQAKLKSGATDLRGQMGRQDQLQHKNYINMRLQNIERRYKKNYMYTSLLGYQTYERNPEEIKKAMDEKERKAALINPGNEVVKKEYFVDDAMQKNPYDDNFQIDVKFVDQYIHRVGKQKVQQYIIKELQNHYDQFKNDVNIPPPSTNSSQVLQDYLQSKLTEDTPAPKRKLFPERLYSSHQKLVLSPQPSRLQTAQSQAYTLPSGRIFDQDSCWNVWDRLSPKFERTEKAKFKFSRASSHKKSPSMGSSKRFLSKYKIYQ